ncbi:MAG TPA: ABC transporter permease, partial [bacterium]|nr:ABC transporter permease [bacterium]
FRQMVESGCNSIPILFLIVFLIGLILAMQGAYQLKKFGMTELVSSLVGVTITREVGPLITAIIISARVGAAITAELGTMAVSEEIMALETMAIRPVPFLVVPRFLALVVMVPCLTLLADIMGMLGGFCIGVTNLAISPYAYIDTTIEGLQNQDIITGLVKSVGFAAVIAVVSCHEGLSVTGGPEGVGTATTRSVVTSILLIILTDLLFTILFYL